MEKKLKLVQEFHDFEELEDYKASLKSIKRKRFRIRRSGNVLEFRDLNYRIIETRNYDKFWPVKLSQNQEYILLQGYEDGKGVVQLRNYKGDRIWEREFEETIYDAFISEDGKNTLLFKGYGGTMFRVVNQIEFYDENGDLIKNVSFEGKLIYADPKIFSDKNRVLLFCTKSFRVSDDGRREISGVVCINAYDFRGNELWRFSMKEQEIHDLKISEDAKTIIAVGEGKGETISGKWEGQGHIYFLNIEGELINEVPFSYGRNLAGIKFTPDKEKYSIIYTGQNIFLFETTTGKICWKYEDPKIYFFVIDVSQGGNIIAGGYGEIPNFYLLLLNNAGEKITETKVDNPEDLNVERVEISDTGETIFLEFVSKALVFNLVQNG